ncbi:Regulator of microtubule dynamics protein 3 [Acropora cervicornis]|uniref:Regulator of microtubule dynamics protein 1 n=1 Tax=Acropora cervicornis TaxID=6130 RepID=A0AAD9QTY9_ACRCE|nr:Regulator of microtubule dynamics protein 3 [Acropora cervicornis]
MASLFSIFDFTFSLSLGRNILFGVSIGLGIGVGIGVGMVASKRIFPFRADDRNLVVLFSELTNEIREIRYVMLKLETSFDKGKSEGIRILKEKGSEDEETDDFEEFFEMSVEEPLQSDNTEDKYKVHGILENSLQKDQQSCDVTWRYARSCFDIATLKGKNGDFEGKRTLLYEGVAKAERALKLDSKSSVAHKWCVTLSSVSFEFDHEHIQKAIELDGSDPCLYHYLGRWCFEVSMLSWWKRTAAATLVAEPPSSTLDEALGNFLKCHYEKGNSQIAADYLKKALALPVSSDDLAMNLLTELA